MGKVISTMAGNVWKVLVKPGDQVIEGQEVVILESMKMEIPIVAESSGNVKEVMAEEGSFVDESEVLIELE